MPRRAAAATALAEPTPTEINFELVKSYVNGQLAPEEHRLAMEMRERIDMFDYVSSVLDGRAREIATVYVYRLAPKIANQGPPFNVRNNQPVKSIDLIPASQFTVDYMRERWGGGKYNFILKSKLDRIEYEKSMDLPWPPRIYPHHKLDNPNDAQFCVMVDADNKPLSASFMRAAPGPGAPVTKEDVPGIIEKATQAAIAGNEAQQKAMDSSFDMMTRTYSRCLETIASKTGTGEESAALQEVRALKEQMSRLEASLKDQRISHLEQQIETLREEFRSGPVANGQVTIMDAGGQVAKELGVEGGILGLAKAVVNRDGGEKSLMDYIGQGIGQILERSGSDLIQGWREWNYNRRLEILQKQNASASATPQPQRPQELAPVQNTAPTEAQNTPAPPVSQEDMFNQLINEITSTIVQYTTEMATLDGQFVAVVIQDKYREYLPLIVKLPMFQDFTKLLEFAQTNENLRQLAEVLDESDFHEFAQDFWNAFQPKKPPQSVSMPPTAGTMKQ